MGSFNFRKTLYWINDTIKGGRTKKHLNEIKTILENPNSKKAKGLTKNNLSNLLNHAINTTNYYNTFKGKNDITDFPVIKKTIIQNNFEDFQSETFKNKKNFKVSTSGSTGLPFTLYQDNNKRNRNKADVIYFLKQCNFEVGDKLYNLAVRLKENQKATFSSWLKNVSLVEISKLSDEAIEHLITTIANDKNPNKSILGYVSGLETIVRYIERKKIKVDHLKLNSIIPNSEYLSPQTKSTLTKHFKTDVLSRYSSDELGILAHQTINSPNNFTINHASYFIEVLNFEDDTPVKHGETGRIIVTDLFNYAMPIIRYDTGDVAKLRMLDNGIFEFEKVEGRKMDLIYDTKGNLLSSYIFYTKVSEYYHLLKQYQFIQQGEKDYEIKLNLHGDKFDFEKEVIEDVKKDFGQDANVKITYVNEIPPLASGKRRKVINNYIKK